MKIDLYNGVCCLRWICRNLNRKFCNPVPEGKKDFVKCKYFENTQNDTHTNN